MSAFSCYNPEDWQSIAAEVEPIFPDLLSGDDFELRKSTITAIGTVGFEGAHRYLIPCLQNADSELRRVTVQALAHTNTPPVVELLCEVMRKDTSDWVRFAAALSLKDFCARAAIPSLQEAMIEDEDE